MQGWACVCDRCNHVTLLSCRYKELGGVQLCEECEHPVRILPYVDGKESKLYVNEEPVYTGPDM